MPGKSTSTASRTAAIASDALDVATASGSLLPPSKLDSTACRSSSRSSSLRAGDVGGRVTYCKHAIPWYAYTRAGRLAASQGCAIRALDRGGALTSRSEKASRGKPSNALVVRPKRPSLPLLQRAR